MAERKSGPVKPPTIDLTARSTESDGSKKTEAKKPEVEKADVGASKPASARTPSSRPASGSDDKRGDKTTAGAATPGKTDDAKAASISRSSAMPLLAVGLAGTILGGALGLGGAYGLATLGYWPAAKTDTSGIEALSSEVSSLYVKKSDIGAVVDNALADVDTGITALDGRIAALETAAPADNGPAIAALDERIGTVQTGLEALSGRLDAATISGGDAAAADAVTGLTESINSVSASMKSLSEKSDALAARVAALEDAGTTSVSADEVAALGQSVDALKTEIAGISSGLASLQSAPEPTPIDLRLPLALSGIAEALDTGAPFAADLAMIRAALPDLDIPAGVADAAASGLGSPADLSARFAARVPDILAARPATDQGDWTAQLWDRVKALVALRPVASGDDASPEAQVARIEAALADRDFAAAARSFASLPDAMTAEAGELGDDIARFAATAELMGKARSAALATTGAGS